jgi:hypothetical protein
MTPATNLADYYFGLLQHLDANNKLELIAQLSQSLKQTEPEATPSLQSLFGAYQAEETADELIASIRAARVSSRQRESL